MPKIELKLDSSFLERWVYFWMAVFLVTCTFSNALLEISFTLAFIGWAVLKIKKWSPPPLEKKALFFLLGFVGISILSFFWSEFPKQSFRGIFKTLQHFLIFWMAAEALAPPSRRDLLLRILVFLFIFLGFDGIWQYVTGTDLLRGVHFEPASSGPRISASFKNYGLLASFVVTFWPILMTRFPSPHPSPQRGEGRVRGLLAILAAGLGALLLFWTRLRGAWLAFLGSLAVYLLVQKKKIYVILLGIAALSGLFLLPRSMIIHQDIEGKEQSVIERFYLWDRALHVIRARPWTGTGINTYALAHQKYDKTESWRVRNYYAHNGCLQIAAETGLPSLACFLLFLFFYFKEALRYPSPPPSPQRGEGKQAAFPRPACGERAGVRGETGGILAGLAGFLMLGLIDTVFHNPQSIMGFWYLAGWGAAVSSSR